MNGYSPIQTRHLRKLAKEGKKIFVMICPGFASDCVETLEEINIQGRETFEEHGEKIFLWSLV